MKNWTWIIVAVVIVAGIAWFGMSQKTNPVTEGNVAFAQWLGEQGVKFYGAFWCPACDAQKKLFGSAADELPYIECSLPDRSAQTEVCEAAGITKYPTWEFADGTRRSAVLSVDQLKTQTGYTAGPPIIQPEAN